METIPTPNEELSFLHEQYKQTKNEEIVRTGRANEEDISKQIIKTYAQGSPRELFGAKHNINETVIAGIVLKLTPEPHDARMEELYRITEGKGVYVALKIVEKLNDPHLEDDFHRFLSELVKEGHGIKGLKEKTDLSKSVRRTLYEIELPHIESKKDDKQGSQLLHELVSKMESIFVILQGEEKEKDTVVLEVANASGREDLIFYAAVPVSWANRFENQVRTAYPEAKIIEARDDYNIFNEKGKIAVSVAALSQSAALPIKTYDSFDHDPMNLLVGAFGKLHKEKEGALVQIIYGAAAKSFVKHVQEKKEAIMKGASPKDILKERGVFGEVFKAFGEIFKSHTPKDAKEKDKKETKASELNAGVLEKLEHKLSRPILPVWIRIATSAENAERAKAIRLDLESVFKQFSEPQGNSLVFKEVKLHDLKKALYAITFRLPVFETPFYLNTAELATIFHFESVGLTSTPELKIARSVSRNAPIDLPKQGILLGVNGGGTQSREVFLSDDDRLRHLYVIGQTGTGKSTLLKNIVIQDVERGDGVCFIDPHGNDIEDVLSRIPPERQKDVIYFDPSNLSRPMALNMLEYDARFPEQKTFVVNELFAIFQKLYGAVPESMGPMFEQYFRNATLLTIEDPGTGSTLLHVSRVLSDKAYRDIKLSHCTNPVVASFWTNIAAKAGGEASLANIVPYITSKFDVFLANDYMRPIIAQERSSLRFREILDEKKILLVNLSKGRLGEINSNLLGLIIVGKILMAALSRVDVPDDSRARFNLVIDEFQNVTTDSIATIFSEARKYKLSLTVAHQYIAQLTENISKAVFGNVGTLASFRVGTDDAEYLEKLFAPQFNANDLGNLPNGIAALKLLAYGKPLEPFDIQTYGFSRGKTDAQTIKNESSLKYGSPREEVEEKIRESFVK
ncbi:MAG TPA: TraM recognition domain-containing protein [Candidatus Paceibacterota bacterium]